MTIRGPLITPVNRRRVPQQPLIGANLQATTLAPAAPAQAPFNQKHWPNPVVRAAYRQLHVFENLQQTTLAPVGAVQAPFNRSEWPNPIRPQVTLARHFLVTTNFYEAPDEVPAIRFDFQNPIIKRKVQQPVVLPNLVLNTLFVTPPVPKVRQEFQNPTIARRVKQPDVLQPRPDFLIFIGSDGTPDQFSLTDQSGVALSSTITSAPVPITGIDLTVSFTATDGTLDVNGDDNFQASRDVVNGDAIRARHTSSASYLTATNTIVTGGGISDTFTSITQGDPANAAYVYRPFSLNWWDH